MAESTTVARPYARAAFESAQERGELKPWADALELAAAIAADEKVRRLLDDPKIDGGQLAELFIQVGGDAFDPGAKNFIRLLAENDRLAALPAITAIYNQMRAEAEGTVEAVVVSAQPLDEAQIAKVTEGLKRRLAREVSVTCEIDESLIGGAVIRAGDVVIDGSVSGRLGKLTSALRH